MTDSLHALVAAELAEPVDPRVTDMAAAIAGLYPAAARAVLYYGSCLRDGLGEGRMLDFYLIVSDYREAYRQRRLALANRLLPPNVFRIAHQGLVAKLAVLSEEDFARLSGPQAPEAAVWARFAQPSRLVWAADEAARAMVSAAVAQAAPTLLGHARPVAGSDDLLELWRTGLKRTYACELRPEPPSRADELVNADPERYRRFARAAEPHLLPVADAGRSWRRLRRRGKRLNLLRLAKARMTYGWDIDYFVSKIGRHSGFAIELKPWQRRWPLLAGLILLPRLLKRRAIR
ncbi:MAG: hypothetical protein ACT4OE_06385 [Sphingosinicella sp.]